MSKFQAEIDLGSLEPIEIPVKFRGRKYILREMSEGDDCAYRNFLVNSARYENGEVKGLNNPADSEPMLVALHLCLTNPDGTLKLEPNSDPENPEPVHVSIEAIRSWPSKAVKQLAKQCREIMGEDTPDTLKAEMEVIERKLKALEVNGEPAKNTPSATAATSA